MSNMSLQVPGWRAVGMVALAVSSVALACAGAGGPEAAPAPGPAPADADARARDRAAERLYRDALNAFEAENYAAAESLADNLVDAYRETRWLGEGLLLSARASLQLNDLADARHEAASYLRLYRASDPARGAGLLVVARVLYLEDRVVAAADSLLAMPEPLGEMREAAAATARRVAGELGLGELEAVLKRWPAGHPLRPAFDVERASLLLAAGQTELGRTVAARVLEHDPLEPERRRADNIVSGELEDERRRPVIGAILPLSGPLAPYGRLAEEGIRLAVEEYNKRHVDSVTLIVRDDGDDVRRAAELMRELEGLGAVAVVGPLRSEALEAAAKNRRHRDLLIISPTAPENVTFESNVYSAWAATERVARSARALAQFAVRDLQLYRFGVMYPNTREGRTQLAAFADAVRAAGAEITGTIAYADSATTFQEQIGFLRQARPQAIFAPAPNARTVIQMAPQFSFYELRGVQVLGDAEWSVPEVLRQVEPRFINGTVVATHLHRASPSVRWPEFVELYERTYRKGLGDSMVPALSYDAARLVLAALPWGFPRRSAIARSFRETRSMPGATGVFYVQDGLLLRRPFVLQIRDRQLVPAFQAMRGEQLGVDGGRGR